MKYTALFVWGKCFMDSEQVILILLNKAFRRQFPFCSSQQSVSVKNELLQYFIQISQGQLIFQFAQSIGTLLLLMLRTSFFGKTGLAERWMAGMKKTFFAIFDPTCPHILALKRPNKEFLKQERQKLCYYQFCDFKAD